MTCEEHGLTPLLLLYRSLNVVLPALVPVAAPWLRLAIDSVTKAQGLVVRIRIVAAFTWVWDLQTRRKWVEQLSS